MNKDTNKNLLNEELKKFKLMSEYAFYEDRGADDEFEKGEELLLGAGMSEEEEEASSEADLDAAADAVSDDLGSDLGPDGGDEEGLDDLESGDELGGDLEAGDELGDDLGGEEPIEEPIDEPVEDDAVELDVTELVQGTEEAKASAQAANASADAANAKMGQLMGMVSKLEQQLDGMSAISHKIDNLETELEKRAPTPEEKIDMRSLDSYPYNLKLTDFWSQQDGQYDVMNQDNDGREPKEYTLTRDDVNSSYSDIAVKDSFDNPYEEEEI